ncbi:MAG: Fosmidomycin resistance protein [Pseudomonas citronellolis]|nr:MAG: Fosmidomycin resistance protein [Pseudomonas citronellolis]
MPTPLPSPAGATPSSSFAPALWLIAGVHLLNDLFQAVLPALYPLLQARHGFSYAQLGAITLVFHLVGCLGQPAVGAYSDRRPTPALLPTAMLCMALGMLGLALADGLGGYLLCAALVGLGSSIFHPEGSRAARAAMPERPGLAQSMFQLGGSIGSATTPLLLALLLGVPLTPLGLGLAGLALGGFALLRRAQSFAAARPLSAAAPPSPLASLAWRHKRRALWVLCLLLLSKYTYLACMANYYTFFLIQRFGLGVAPAQLALGLFLLAITAGTLLGGPLVDRLGRRRVIILSILGSSPFALALPWVPLALALLLSVLVGLLIASAFAAILLLAQDMLPGRQGLVAGGFFGLTFGVSGIAAAALGSLADHYGLPVTFAAASALPLCGLLALRLPASPTPIRPAGPGEPAPPR